MNNGATGTSWASAYGVDASGNLCLLENQNRIFTISNVACNQPYNLALVTPPPTCKCIAPLDVAVSMLYFSLFSDSLNYYL